MRIGSTAACVAAALFFATSATGQDGGKDAKQALTDADGCETLRLPADWTATPVKLRHETLGAWKVGPPDAKDAPLVFIALLDGARDERLETTHATQEVEGARFEAKPVPHALYEMKTDKGATSECRVVRVVRRRGFVLALSGPKASFDAALPAFLDAAATFETTRGEYPDIPDSYRRVTRDGYLYRLHPAVKDADVGAVHKFLLAQEAAFARRFGPVPKNPDCPMIVVMHATVEDAANSGIEGAPKDDKASVEFGAGVVFAFPPRKDDVKYAGDLALSCSLLFDSQTFGLADIGWLRSGGTIAAAAETTTGKPLPDLAESFTSLLPASLPAFTKVVEEPSSGTNDLAAMIYMAFLRSGAKPFCDAFDAYVKALRGGVSPAKAVKPLLALDQDKLRAGAEAYMKTLRVVKGR